MHKPIISISLGCPAIFLIGGRSRSDPPTPLLVRSGDVIVMARESRLTIISFDFHIFYVLLFSFIFFFTLSSPSPSSHTFDHIFGALFSFLGQALLSWSTSDPTSKCCE